MFNLIKVLIVFACVYGHGRAQISTLKLSDVKNSDNAELHYRPELKAENGIIILCPGMNGNGSSLLEEADWRRFAAEKGLGLAAVSFRSPPHLLYGNPAKGYYYPEQGSGSALLAGIDQVYGSSKNIFIYGFSGGAQFCSRFSEQNSSRIKGWAAYSASFWSAPISAGPLSPQGIVACGELDAVRYGPSFAYFQQGRRRDARWTWISLGNVGHVRHRNFEEFVRFYFAAILVNKFDQEQWLDAETKQPTTEDDRLLNPALSVWLPTPEVGELWRKLHHP